MRRYILARLVQLIPVLFGVSLISFGVLHLIPGDPAAIIADPRATPEELDVIREEFGLNDPLPVQYVRYVGNALHGDLGMSVRTRQPVANLLASHIGFTFQLSVLALLVSIIIGVPAGIIAALHRNTWIDGVASLGALAGLSVPSFWLGLMSIVLFSVVLRWLPAGGTGSPGALVLPAIVLGASAAAVLTRMTRAAMLDVLGQDYIRTMRAMGVSRTSIVLRHALRNALNPVITLIGLEFGSLLAGAVVVESVFALPGVGRLMVNSLLSRDYPIVQGGMLMIAMSFVVVNLLTDLLYAVVNPRVRLARG
jgi:peptide/nickel transport system permease protein